MFADCTAAKTTETLSLVSPRFTFTPHGLTSLLILASFVCTMRFIVTHIVFQHISRASLAQYTSSPVCLTHHLNHLPLLQRPMIIRALTTRSSFSTTGSLATSTRTCSSSFIAWSVVSPRVCPLRFLGQPLAALHLRVVVSSSAARPPRSARFPGALVSTAVPVIYPRHPQS